MPTVLHDHALGLFLGDDFEHVFQRERFEIQSIRSVVVSRNCLRIAVDHDGFVAILAQSECCVHAAIVELDALTDSIRATTEHHDLVACGWLGFALFLIRRIEIRGGRGEFGGAGIDALVNRPYLERPTQVTDGIFVGTEQLGQSRIRESLALERAHAIGVDRRKALLCNLFLDRDQVFNLGQEPGVNVGQIENFGARQTGTKPITDIKDALRTRFTQFTLERGQAGFAAQIELHRTEAVLACFEPAQSFLH